MAQIEAFPMSLEQFAKAVAGKEKAFESIGDVKYVYNCLKMGWINKQYRKNKQERDKEQDRVIKAAIAADPDLRRRLGLHEKGKGV